MSSATKAIKLEKLKPLTNAYVRFRVYNNHNPAAGEEGGGGIYRILSTKGKY